MKKYLQTLLLLAALLAPWATKAQDDVIIGDTASTGTVYYLPVNMYFNYSVTQQIFTPTEIGGAGTITSISFMYTNAAAFSMNNVQMYMKNVTKSSFTSNTDMEAISSSDLVWSGTFSATEAGWVTINLDTPFQYDGISNLLLCCYDSVGGYPGSAFKFRTSSTDDDTLALDYYSDSYIPNLSDLTTFSGSKAIRMYRNVIRLGMQSAAGGTTVTIGDTASTATNSYLPMNSLYNYSYTQQIYTSEEIGGAGTITSITVWLKGNNNLYTMPFDIYMVETNKTSFTSNTDWETVTTADIVHSDSVTVHHDDFQPYTFILNTPFNYSGTGNLMIAFDNNTGSWKSGLYGKVFGESSDPVRSIYARQDGSNYDPTNMSGVSAYGTTYQRNVIILDITSSSVVTCERPSTLSVDNITTSGATCSWSSTVGNYQFEYKKASESAWTTVTLTDTFYVLTALDDFTAYNVRVKSLCATSESSYKAANFTTLEGCPEGNVCIGAGTATNSYLPTYAYYNYSLTQQIYTAAEIGGSGAIGSVAFYCSGNLNRTLDIYLVNTTKSGFDSANDWIPVTSADLVYSGSVEFTANAWTTITFENPFVYDGTGNLAIIVDDNTGSYVSSPNFFVFDDPNSRAIRIYSDGTNYDPSAPSGYTGTVLNVKNRVRLSVGAVPTCFPVRDLTVGNVAGHSVELTWSDTINTGATYTVYDMSGTTVVATGIAGTTYTVTGLNPETDYTFGVTANCSATDASSMRTISVTTDVACPAPEGLHADNISGNTADLMWNGTAASYNLEYAPCTPAANWLQYDNDTLVANVGSTGGGTWTWGVMYPDSLVTGNILTKIAFYEVASSYYTDNTIIVNVYNGGATAPETLLGTFAVAVEGTNGMREVAINPIQIDPTQNLWITLTASATYCIAMSDQNAGINGRWCWTGSSCYDFSTVYAAGAAYSFMIRAYTGTVSGSWTAATGVTSPYALSNLDPQTDYIVKVKSNCGDVDGESVWSSTQFTTDVACPVPSALAATNITGSSATLDWTGFNDSYNVRYRTAEFVDTLFFDNFENGLGQWTILQGASASAPAGGVWYTINPIGSLSFAAFSGDSCASSWSWNNTAYQADNWLITPQVALGGTLKFRVRTSSSWPDSYEVLLSTTDNDTDSFTATLQAMAPAPNNDQWNEVTIDLSNYSGNGYIAIHHVDYDMNYLLIDDFAIYGDTTAAGTWTTVTATTDSVDITGLDDNTLYEFQVQGVCTGATTAWSDSYQFTTLAVHSVFVINEYMTACDSYTWRGTTYTATTMASETVSTATADTIYHLYLTINYSNTGVETVTACDSYTWHGTDYTASTDTPTYTSTNAAGCDSVTTLNLTINYSVYDTITVNATDYYVWHDITYTQSGTYTYTDQTIAGCDSVETLILTLDTTPDVYYNVTIIVASTDGYLNVGGSIDGGGTYLAGTEVTLTATPDSGYLFNGWYTQSATGTGGELLETDSIYTFTLDSNIVLVAIFEHIGSNSALLTVAVDPTLGRVLFNGMTQIYNTYQGTLGETVTLTAVAINNSTFLGWVDATGDTLSRDEVYDFTLEQVTTTLTAAFRAYVGIDDINASSVTIFAREHGVVVRGAAQQQIHVFDVVGRMVGEVNAAADEEFVRLSQTGVYLVKVGNLPACRVLVCE